MIKYLLNLILSIVSVFCLYSCANVSAPTGGPKDIAPPKLVEEKSFPLPNTINYSGNVVELTFNESITVENIQDQLLITPLEENTYKAIPRKNKIRIEFEKPFSPNTTYTLNFRESIKDVTEGNIVPNLILPFSTGPYLDSIYISGIVVDLKTNLPQENALVSLYKNNDTLSPSNSKPIYFTQTTKEGTFRIQNIKSGTYDLYAINDQNKNLRYEEPEKIYYLKNITLDSSRTDIRLEITNFDAINPYIKRMNSFSNTFEIIFNEGIHNITVKSDATKEALYTPSRDGRTLHIYNTFEEQDSIPLNIQLSDSSDNVFDKEIKIYFTQEKEKKEEVLLMEVMPKDRMLTPNKATINLIFNKPVTKFSLKDIRIKEDTLIQQLLNENATWINKSNLEISKEIKARDSLFLIIPENTFYYINTGNKTDTIIFDIKEEGNYGSISGKIITSKPNYIIELLDANYNVVEKLMNPTTFNFTFLNPGSYSLRAIVDENNNKRWDSGNLKKSIQPEPVILFKNKIELRANWEILDIVFEF